MNILFSLLSAFVGFASGRFGDKWGGHLNVPHHWIYGVLLVIGGVFIPNTLAKLSMICYGIGLFISDLNDFLHLRFYGPDEPHEWKFWGID